MRYSFFIILFLLVSNANAFTYLNRDGVFDGNSVPGNSPPDFNNSSVCAAVCATYNNNCGQYNSNPVYSNSFFPPGTGAVAEYGYVCDQSKFHCPIGHTFSFGYCTSPDNIPPQNCPPGYASGPNSGGTCVDPNGCIVGKVFFAGSCVPRYIEHDVSNCLGLAGSTGVASLNISQTGEKTCIVGSMGEGTAANCQQIDGTACFADPSLANGKSGWQCGSFNGKSLCVASASTGAVGVGDKPLGTSSSTGKTETFESQLNDGTFTTTTTKNVTPTTSSQTSLNDPSQLLKEGQSVDAGAGISSPYVCSDGRKSANLASCDSAVVCPSDQYLAYGACIKMPTRTTSTVKESTITDVVKRDNATGQIVSSTTTSSSTTTALPVSSTEPSKKGQCDPTAANYQKCVGLLEDVSDTKSSEIKTSFSDSATAALDRLQSDRKSSIESTSDGLGVDVSGIRTALSPFIFQATACQPMEISFVKSSASISCDKIEFFKNIFGWVLYISTLIYLFHLFFKPLEK